MEEAEPAEVSDAPHFTGADLVLATFALSLGFFVVFSLRRTGAGGLVAGYVLALAVMGAFGYLGTPRLKAVGMRMVPLLALVPGVLATTLVLRLRMPLLFGIPVGFVAAYLTANATASAMTGSREAAGSFAIGAMLLYAALLAIGVVTTLLRAHGV